MIILQSFFLNDRSDPFFLQFFFLKRNSSSSYGFFVDVLYRINKVLMTLKNCQICYQVESDTLNYFYKNSFSNKK